MSEAMKRQWQMMHICAGDWVLPSNDMQTLWRIRRDREIGDDDRDVMMWQVWRWPGRGWRDATDAITESLVDGDLSDWEYVAGSCRTRAEAIEEAMRL
jgi:hypothetical protein